MSLDATRWAYQQQTGSSAKKSVLVSMADRCGEDHTCYPSIQRIAKDTELNEKTVRKAIHDLCEMGLLSWTGETRGLGARVYKLNGVNDRHNISAPTNFGSTKNGSTPLPKTDVPPTNFGSTPLPILGVKPINESTKESINESGKESRTPEKPKSQNSDLENPSQKKTKKSDLEKMGIKPPVRITNLTDLGVSPQVAYDFLLNKKNHEITHTALVRNQNQAEKAGLTLDKALEFAVNKGWQAFTADYYFNATRSQGQTHANTQPAYQNHATAPAQSSHATYNDNLMAELERELAKQQSQYAPDDRYHGNVYDMETPV